MKSLFLTLSKAEHIKMQFVAKVGLFDVLLSNYCVAYIFCRPMFAERVLNRTKIIYIDITCKCFVLVLFTCKKNSQ